MEASHSHEPEAATMQTRMSETVAVRELHRHALLDEADHQRQTAWAAVHGQSTWGGPGDLLRGGWVSFVKSVIRATRVPHIHRASNRSEARVLHKALLTRHGRTTLSGLRRGRLLRER